MRPFLTHLLHRPVAATACYALLSALAVMALIRLPVELLPSLSYPSLVIWTPWPETPPDQVERGVTRSVEEAVAGIPGIAALTSKSQLGGSLVRVDFGWNVDLDLAALDVRQKLDRLTGSLPERSERPLVLRVNPGDRPILVIGLGLSATQDPTAGELIDLKAIGEDVVARRLEQLEDVARVRVTGGHEREIQVQMRADRMAAHGVDLNRIETALRDANVSLAGGTVRKGPFRYAVEVSGEFREVGDVAAAVVSKQGAPTVRLAEVARITEGVARRHGMVRLDGSEVLLLLVERRPDANTVRAAAQARQALSDLRAELPGVSLEVVVDESVFIEAAIGGVSQALAWGGVLAVAVLLIFLRRPRMLAAVAVAVPLSLAVALVLFDLLDVTLNLISLSGLALGVGLLVDNAIVVVENIARLREAGLTARGAAAQGAAEVAGPITASTLTTLAVFLPLTFVEGLAGRLFRDQSLAVVCSVGASLVVALTVVPLIASRERRAELAKARRNFSPGLTAYERCLDGCLAHPRWVMAGAVIFLLLTVALAFELPRETIPETDEGRLAVHFTLPPGADLALVAERSEALERALASLPGVARVLADLGERDDARLDLDPRPPYEGDLIVVVRAGTSSSEVLQQLATMSFASDLTVEARPVKPQLETLLVTDEADLLIDLVSEDRAAAARAVPALLSALERRPELTNVARSDPEGVPAYDLQFDWDAMARFGARSDLLDGYLEAAARGREATRLHRMREEVPIVVRSAPAGSVEELLGEQVPAAAGLLPLGTFVRAQSVSLPSVLIRSRQAPVVRLLADLAPGAGLDEALTAVDAAVQTTVPPEIRVRVGGTNEAFRQSLEAVGWSLLLSLALVYLILAAQFESLIQPLVVLSVVPLAIGGVALVLALTGHSWNLMSMTGCVVLVGIAVNDAIIKVDFIRQRRRDGLSVGAAIRQAGRDRFRPIVMTTLTTSLGLLPLALGWGAGGKLQSSVAISILGGLIVATLLTLLIVPSLYIDVKLQRLSVGLSRSE